jgi:hypothetical protein
MDPKCSWDHISKARDPESDLRYCQVDPSLLPNTPAKKKANVESKLDFNMSVTSLRGTATSGSGKPRYGLPDAPLTQSARLRLSLRRPGSPYLVSFREWVGIPATAC